MQCRVSDFRPDSLFQELILILEDGYFSGDLLNKAEIIALCPKSHEPDAVGEPREASGAHDVRFTAEMSRANVNVRFVPLMGRALGRLFAAGPFGLARPYHFPKVCTIIRQCVEAVARL
jgi:hypothetical protein